MIGQLAKALGAVVLRVNDALDQVFRGSVDDERWRRGLLAVLEGIGVLRFQLGHVEHRVNANCGRESKSKRVSRRLGNDREGANLLLGKFPCSTVGADVICMYVHTISNMEGRRLHAMLVCSV